MFFSQKNAIKKLNSALTNSFQNVKQDIAVINNNASSTSQQIANLYAWVNYIYKQNKEIRHQNVELMRSMHSVEHTVGSMNSDVEAINAQFHQVNSQINEVTDRVLKVQRFVETAPMTKEDIKRIIDYYYSFEEAINKVNSMEGVVTSLVEKFDKISRIKDFDMASQLQNLAEIKELRHKIAVIEEKERKPSSREKLIKKITRRSRDYVKNLILSYIRKYEKISALRLRDMVVEEQGLASKSAFYRMLDEIEAIDEIEVVREGKEKFFFSKVVKHT